MNMNSNIVRILLIAAGVIVLYYLMTRYFQSKENENFYNTTTENFNEGEGEEEV